MPRKFFCLFTSSTNQTMRQKTNLFEKQKSIEMYKTQCNKDSKRIIDMEGKKVTTNYLRCSRRHCWNTKSNGSEQNLLSIKRPYLTQSYRNLFEIFRNLMKQHCINMHGILYENVYKSAR